MHEARIEKTDAGLVPADNGWFVLNLRDIAWWTIEVASHRTLRSTERKTSMSTPRR